MSKTILEATREWVGGFNALPYSLIEKALKGGLCLNELYKPFAGEEFTLNDGNTWILEEVNENECVLSCISYDKNDFKDINEYENDNIDNAKTIDDSDELGIYCGDEHGVLDCFETYHVELNGNEFKVIITKDVDDIEGCSNIVNYSNSFLPIWGTMWTFGDSVDEWWAEENIDIMRANGFRVYKNEEDDELYFGIDGAGYDFYEAHWVPLYKASGLQWHKQK